MNKQDLVNQLADRLEVSKPRAAAILDALFSPEGIISVALKQGDKVQVSGFGQFETRQRKAREGRNPRTGETLSIAASTVPAFKPAKGLKDLLND